MEDALDDVMAWIRSQASVGHLRFTQHAAVEMADEDVLLEDSSAALDAGEDISSSLNS